MRVGQDGGQACIDVADSGPGIPEEERERVFDRFYRGHQALGGGSGLGLAIVRQIVTLHGGTIGLGKSASGGLLVSARFPASGSPVEQPVHVTAPVSHLSLT